MVVSVDTFVANWPDDRVVFIARGSYSPDDKADRYSIYTLEDRGRLERLGDHWLRTEDLVAVRERFPTCKVGESDAMYSTRPSLVWCRLEDDLLVVWSGTRRLAMFEGRRILLRRLHKWKQLITPRLVNVEVHISDNWVTCSVRLNADDEHWDVARRREPFALIDPTYDGINLLADTHWASSLGAEISALTKLPLVEAEP